MFNVLEPFKFKQCVYVKHMISQFLVYHIKYKHELPSSGYSFGLPPQRRLPNDWAAFLLHYLLRFHGGQSQAYLVQLEQPKRVPLQLLTSVVAGCVKLPRQCPRKEVSVWVTGVKINHTKALNPMWLVWETKSSLIIFW